MILFGSVNTLLDPSFQKSLRPDSLSNGHSPGVKCIAKYVELQMTVILISWHL